MNGRRLFLEIRFGKSGHFAQANEAVIHIIKFFVSGESTWVRTTLARLLCYGLVARQSSVLKIE